MHILLSISPSINIFNDVGLVLKGLTHHTQWCSLLLLLLFLILVTAYLLYPDI